MQFSSKVAHQFKIFWRMGSTALAERECLSESLRRQRQLPKIFFETMRLSCTQAILWRKSANFLHKLEKNQRSWYKWPQVPVTRVCTNWKKTHIHLFRSFYISGNNEVFKWDLSMVSLSSVHPFWFYLWRPMHTAQLWLQVIPLGNRWRYQNA